MENHRHEADQKLRIARIFPRKSKATPDDIDSFFDVPPKLYCLKYDEIHVSVSFSWDIRRAEYLAKEWEQIAPVKIGGPAMGTLGENFKAGMYLKHGYTITSRGCPNKCWFCQAWKRDGNIRELQIIDGWNVLDDNLLACSDEHIRSVFSMLSKQKNKAEFTGGLEAAILKDWHVNELIKLKPKQMFFAYDTPNDLEPLIIAGKMFKEAGLNLKTSHSLRCFVLCGYKNDTFEKAEKRMNESIKAGFMPMAMLWRDEIGKYDYEWKRFQREWARPIIVASKMKNIGLI